MLEKDLVQLIEKAAIDGREYLDLAYRKLDYLPANIVQLTKLETLNLRANNLTSLPPEIGQLIKLERLHRFFKQIN